MRSIAALCALLCLAAAPASAAVTVSFLAPDSFTDIGDRAINAPNPRLLRELTAYFQDLGAKHLPPGQALTIEVRDIDRAGRIDPFLGYGEGPRVLSDVTWPKLTLRYELREGGRLLAGAEATLRDQGYLQHARAYGGGDELRYEKRMIEDWFAATFGAPAR